jgi:3-oxoacyl-[acyl-carrier protein] reductase
MPWPSNELKDYSEFPRVRQRRNIKTRPRFDVLRHTVILQPSSQERETLSDNDPGTALVIGGSRGIGRAVALRLARAGFDIWLTYRSKHEQAAEVKLEIENIGRLCELLCFDVGDRAATDAALRDRAEKTSPAVVVFNAGVTRDNLLVWMKPEEWSDVIRTDLDGFFNVTSAILFSMIRARRGRIVAVSSISGQVGQAGQVNYSAAKAGLIGACKALAREVGKRNICVNVVAPGLIETDMTEHLPKDKILPMIPLGRIGTVDDVASVIEFLCREPSMYIHGQVIGINGGLAT